MKPKQHAHQWREMNLYMNKTRGDGMVIQCATCKEIEFLTERAAREFRRQRARGIEPHFDSEGLVVVRRVARANQTAHNEFSADATDCEHRSLRGDNYALVCLDCGAMLEDA